MPSQEEVAASLLATQGQAAVAAAGGPPAYQTRSLSQSSRQPSESGPPARRAATLARDKTAAAMAPISESQDGEETPSGSEDEGDIAGGGRDNDPPRLETSPALASHHDGNTVHSTPRPSAAGPIQERLSTFSSVAEAREELCRACLHGGGVPMVTVTQTKCTVTCGANAGTCKWESVARKLSRGKDKEKRSLPDKWVCDVIQQDHQHRYQGAQMHGPSSTSSSSRLPPFPSSRTRADKPQGATVRTALSPSDAANRARAPNVGRRCDDFSPFYPQELEHDAASQRYLSGSQVVAQASTSAGPSQPRYPPSASTRRDAGPSPQDGFSLQELVSSLSAAKVPEKVALFTVEAFIKKQATAQDSPPPSPVRSADPSTSQRHQHRDAERNSPSRTLLSSRRSSGGHGASARSSHRENARESSSRRRDREDYSSENDDSYYSQGSRHHHHRHRHCGREYPRERENKRRRSEKSDYWSPGRSHGGDVWQAEPRRGGHHDIEGYRNYERHDRDERHRHDHSIRPKEERSSSSRSHRYRREDERGRRSRHASPRYHEERRSARSPSATPPRRHHRH